MREKRENVGEEARRQRKAFVTVYGPSSTRIEHRQIELVQAASGYAYRQSTCDFRR